MSKPRAKKRAAARKSDADAPATEPAPAGANLLADIQQQCDALRTWHESATAQLVEREAELERFAQALGQQQEQQTQEAQRLLDAQAQLEADRQQVTHLRGELDAEWDSIRQLRKAHEQVGRELDAERTRLNRDAFKFSKAAARKAA